jgi:hypothetical protein
MVTAKCSWPGCPRPGEFGAFRHYAFDGGSFSYYCSEHIERIEADNLLIAQINEIDPFPEPKIIIPKSEVE